MLISIIIPVFNQEKYLDKCLSSIECQTYPNIEIILINDGSTDNSKKICEQYVKRDIRFKLINQLNQGVSSARNEGLKSVSGEYICFVDADDWIDSDMIENIVKKLKKEKPDIVCYGYSKESIDGQKIYVTKKSGSKQLKRKEAINNVLNIDGYRGFLFNKVFSAEIIKKYNVSFDKNIHFCEDMLFVVSFLRFSNSIYYDSNSYYHYIMHETNVSKEKISPKRLTSIDAIRKIIDLLNNDKEADVNLFKTYYVHMNIALLMQVFNSESINNELKNKLTKNLYMFDLKDIEDRKVKISCLMARLNTKIYYYLWNILKNNNIRQLFMKGV